MKMLLTHLKSNKTIYALLILLLLLISIGLGIRNKNVTTLQNLIDSTPFIKLSTEYNWENVQNFSDYWPQQEAYKNIKVKYTTNNNGFRINEKSELDQQNQENNPIILISGDSTPFGFGVAAEYIFAEKLRKYLISQKYNLDNLSVIGYTSTQSLKKINSYKHLNNIKIIVFWVGLNDLQPVYNKTFFDKLIQLYRYQTLKSNIKKLVSLCTSKNILLILHTLPTKGNYEEINMYNVWLRKNFQSIHGNIHLLDIEKIFYEHEKINLYASIDNTISNFLGISLQTHPNEEGHNIIFQKQQKIIQGYIENNNQYSIQK